jgi:hypothetical protein
MEKGLSSYKWAISPLVTIAILIGGMVAQWTVLKYNLGTAQAAQVTIEKRVDTVEKKVQDIEISKAVSEADIKTIKDDISEIKKDVKSILRGNK